MKLIRPSSVDGIVIAPASKSEAQRAIAAASLAEGTSVLTKYSPCDDSEVSLNIVRALGSDVRFENGKLFITGGRNILSTTLECGESGLSFRLFASIAALRDEEIQLVAQGTLKNRPIDMVESTLNQLGVTCRSENGFPPLTVKGPLTNGTVRTDGSISSQHVSGLLFALPLVRGDSCVIVNNVRSKPYLRMTLSTLERFGVQIENDKALTNFMISGGQAYGSTNYQIEGDWSGAAFLLVAAAIAGRISIENLKLNSHQADREIMDVLVRSGADVMANERTVTVSHKDLLAFRFDASDYPDLIPPLTVLASCCRGTTVVSGAERLKTKESDRSNALIKEFTAIGVEIREHRGNLEIKGGPISGGKVRTHQDHRIAMALAVAALRSKKGIELDDASCVVKSYPDFFDDLERITV